jgi:hypothetical protein
MAHNSPEEREKGEALARKLEQLLAMARDKELQAKISQSVEACLTFMKAMREKVEYEPLSQDELAMLDEAAELLPKLQSLIHDCHLALGNHLALQAETQYYHFKQLAETGNLQAKEAFEKLQPHYREIVRERLDKQGLN